MNVVQDIEYVKQEAKVVFLLECLQKTAPPVLIFAEKKQDVDQIHEYLLLKADGCSYCGGLGHRITECPKLEAIPSKQASNMRKRDFLSHTDC